MNRRISIVLSLSMTLNALAYTGALAYAEGKQVDDQAGLVVEELISNDNLKMEDVSTSIPKAGTDNVTNPAMQLENLADVKAKIEADAKVVIELPTSIDQGQSIISGKLVRGIGVSVYSLTDKEFSDKKFVPTADALITNSKYNVNTQDGKFSLALNTANLKPGSHLAICIYYSLRQTDGKIVNKNYFINATYGQAGAPIAPQPQKPSQPIDERRISGEDRFATNLASVRKTFTSSQTVVVASGNSFADPLAAGPLAMKYSAPIIFSDKSGLRPDAVKLIKELGAKNVIIVGGLNSVPASVVKQLAGLSVRRISGNDRYETSAKLVKEFGPSRHIIFTDGRKFADALSATPLAKKLSSPILLVNGIDKLPNNINSYHDTYIIGGKNSVGLDVENRLKSIKGDKSYRIYGQDREATSYQVASVLKFSGNIIANGNSFADALSAVNLLNNGGKNLILVKKNSISKDNKELTENKANYIIGGYNTVSKTILAY